MSVAADVPMAEAPLVEQEWAPLVERELAALQDGFQRVMKLLAEQCAYVTGETRKLEEGRKKSLSLQGRMCSQTEDTKVKLDVGGRQFETTLQTLTSEPGSMLEAMFSGRFAVLEEQDQTVFLDRDPTHFETILNYLRDRGKNPEMAVFCDVHAIHGRERLRLLREVTYYGIDGLKQMLERPTLIVSQDQTLLQQLNCEDGPGAHQVHFTSIQEAIQAADHGHRIVVCAGTYTEALVIDKPLNVCGYPSADRVVIRSQENVVVANAQNVVLSHLTLRQLGGKFNGVLVYDGMLTIEHCDISSAGLGCFAVRNARAIIRHNKVHDSPQGGMVFCEGAEGLVEQNQIYSNGLQGIEIREGSKPTILRNHIHNSEQNGILIHSKGRGEVLHNEIFNNKIDGIMVISEASPSSIQHNHIHHNRQRGVFVSRDSNGNGISLDSNVIQHNSINLVKEE